MPEDEAKSFLTISVIGTIVVVSVLTALLPSVALPLLCALAAIAVKEYLDLVVSQVTE